MMNSRKMYKKELYNPNMMKDVHKSMDDILINLEKMPDYKPTFAKAFPLLTTAGGVSGAAVTGAA